MKVFSFWLYTVGKDTPVLFCILLIISVSCVTTSFCWFPAEILLALISPWWAKLIMDKATTHTQTFHCRLCNEANRGEKWIAVSWSIQVIRCRSVFKDYSRPLWRWSWGSGVQPLAEQRHFTMCLSSDGSRANLPAYPYAAYYSTLFIPRPCTIAPGSPLPPAGLWTLINATPGRGLRHTFANRKSPVKHRFALQR